MLMRNQLSNKALCENQWRWRVDTNFTALIKGKQKRVLIRINRDNQRLRKK